MNPAPVVQTISHQARQRLVQLRNRFSTAEKAEKGKAGNVLRTSLVMHRPVWVTAGTGIYTSAAAALIAMRCFRHLR
ncbi:hypothetical protein PHISCL_09157 [Aspergillus sclerotialis]|uniref:Uncharacterized protein n=1 Tax=Aspergillus sclerotialis TaxID=2070753 RepID=A0A3A2ZGQ3_9EURO|nr:hypothetical protein PHISCL_09157 [Aspergillus sclerotialis]